MIIHNEIIMVVNLVPRVVITFLFIMFQLATAAPPITMWPNCTSSCGDITIPYPFGMESGCYQDEAFKIHCNKSGAFLSGTQMVEVLNVSLELGTVTVKGPIIYSVDCSRRSISALPLNLTGTVFFFSRYANILVVSGARADLKHDVFDEPYYSPPLRSYINQQEKAFINSSEDSFQIQIPQLFQVFNPKIEAKDSIRGRDRCKLAFIANRTWFIESNKNDLFALHKIDYVPVEIGWITKYNSSTFNSSAPQSCLSYSEHFGAECWCRSGFEGNPFLENGCLDIDECKDPTLHTCRGITKCVNRWGDYTCEVNKCWIIIIVVGTVVVILLLMAGIWGLYQLIKERQNIELKKKNFKRNGGLLLKQQLFTNGDATIQKTKIFTSIELEKATDNFNKNRILGQGGQGTVYKGMLADGRIVAIKKSIVVDDGKLEEFINEIVILSQINHRNVVKLFGCCLETEVPLLVYEFISNGTLSEYIQGQHEELQLSWKNRLRIASEVAGSLSYLHSAASIPIYHRDIKSSNILLDEKYRAKVSDFGASRSITIDQTHLTTRVAGTFGYLDPEYFQSSQFTEKSDVYSFGVILVELLSGQKPIFSITPTEYKSLASQFLFFMEDNRLLDILDSRVRKNLHNEEVIAVANLAKKCLNLNGKNRPTMKEVAMELDRIQSSRKGSNIVPENGGEIDGEYSTVMGDVVLPLSGCTFEICGTPSPSPDVESLISS